MSDITSANAVLMLSIDGLYPTPQQLQGFSADDIFEAESVDTKETSMGVDGRFSAGFVFKEVPWSVTLQADSASNDIFDNWYAAEQAAKAPYFASATVLLPAISKKWAMLNGVMVAYSPMPAGKKFLQPRKFTIHWGQLQPAVM
jgi:hypothetical protein